VPDVCYVVGVRYPLLAAAAQEHVKVVHGPLRVHLASSTVCTRVSKFLGGWGGECFVPSFKWWYWTSHSMKIQVDCTTASCTIVTSVA